MDITEFVDSIPDKAFEQLLAACVKRAAKKGTLTWESMKILPDVIAKTSADNIERGVEETAKLINTVREVFKSWKASV